MRITRNNRHESHFNVNLNALRPHAIAYAHELCATEMTL